MYINEPFLKSLKLGMVYCSDEKEFKFLISLKILNPNEEIMRLFLISLTFAVSKNLLSL